MRSNKLGESLDLSKVISMPKKRRRMNRTWKTRPKSVDAVYIQMVARLFVIFWYIEADSTQAPVLISQTLTC